MKIWVPTLIQEVLARVASGESMASIARERGLSTERIRQVLRKEIISRSRGPLSCVVRPMATKDAAKFVLQLNRDDAKALALFAAAHDITGLLPENKSCQV